MRRLFAWYITIPITVLFIILNHQYLTPANFSLTTLYVSIAITLVCAGSMACIHEWRVQNLDYEIPDETGKRLVALYLIFIVGLLSVWFAIDKPGERNATQFCIENLLFCTTYSVIGTIWLLAELKTNRHFKHEKRTGKKKK